MSDQMDPEREQARMDRFLRETMAQPEPQLSASFDRTLSRRLRPRRLSAGGRIALALYVLVAVVFSVWVMRREDVEWGYVAAALLVPVASLGVFVLRSAMRAVREA